MNELTQKMMRIVETAITNDYGVIVCGTRQTYRILISYFYMACSLLKTCFINLQEKEENTKSGESKDIN